MSPVTVQDHLGRFGKEMVKPDVLSVPVRGSPGQDTSTHRTTCSLRCSSFLGLTNLYVGSYKVTQKRIAMETIGIVERGLADQCERRVSSTPMEQLTFSLLEWGALVLECS